MYTKIEIPMVGDHSPFWQFDNLMSSEYEAQYPYALGLKTFISNGQFEYHWPLQFLSREDVQAIVDAGQRLLDITKEA